MERMVNNRLVWFLETNKLITPLQCGFRKQRNITEHLVRLESLENLLFNGNMLLLYFLTRKRPTIVHRSTASWKTSIKQVCMALDIYRPCFIEGFLKNRQLSARLGACLSGLIDQEMGVPEGSVLSVTLFALKINSIVKTIFLVSNVRFMWMIF